MDGSITRAEHEEFRRRLEEENRRQDKRIELLEDNMRELNQSDRLGRQTGHQH